MELDYTILKLIGEASLLVKLVMLVLVLASIVSWTLMFVKSGAIRKAKQSLKSFETKFWSGISLKDLYNDLSQNPSREGIEKIFFDGYHEYKRDYDGTPSSSPTLMSVEAAQRAMFVSESREVDKLENNLSLFATIGSVSPYIGLFGTVWGIMTSFIALGQMQQATLETVAPGIAEALIATAFGLFAAIPAYIAYNRYTSQVDRLALSYENFRTEFMILLDRHRHSLQAPKTAVEAPVSTSTVATVKTPVETAEIDKPVAPAPVAPASTPTESERAASLSRAEQLIAARKAAAAAAKANNAENAVPLTRGPQ